MKYLLFSDVKSEFCIMGLFMRLLVERENVKVGLVGMLFDMVVFFRVGVCFVF